MLGIKGFCRKRVQYWQRQPAYRPEQAAGADDAFGDCVLERRHEEISMIMNTATEVALVAFA